MDMILSEQVLSEHSLSESINQSIAKMLHSSQDWTALFIYVVASTSSYHRYE